MKKDNFQKVNINISNLKELWAFIKANWLVFVIFAVIGFVVFGNVIRGEFLNIDDREGIVLNQEVRDLNGSLKTFQIDKIYMALVYKFFGLNSSVFHFVAILNHVIATSVIFIFVYMLFGKKIALISSLLYLVHPVNTEAISWISARPYIYFTTIQFIIYIFWVLYRKSGKLSYLIFLNIYFGLMIITLKPAWLMTVPIMMVVLDIFYLDTFSIKKKEKEEKIWNWIKKSVLSSKNISASLGYFFTILISAIFTISYVSAAYTSRVSDLKYKYYFDPTNTTPFLNRIPYIVYMQIRFLVLPDKLSIYHEGNVITNLHYLVMLHTTIAVIFLILFLLKRGKKVTAGLIISSFAAIAPSFSPVSIAWLSAERYYYMAAMFFTILLAMGINKIHEKNKNLGNSVFITLMLLYSARSALRTNDFVSSKNLWISTEKTAPYSYRVYNNLGDVFSTEGNYEQAVKYFERSLQLKPEYADAVHNLGFAHMQLGDYDKARMYLVRSINMNPALHPSFYKLGLLEYNLKNYEQSKGYLEQCVVISPNNYYCVELLKKVDEIIKSL